MFKQLFWKYLPRYGMKKTYDSFDRIENDVRTFFVLNKYASITSYIMGHNSLHIAPRGNCGAKGKVLCYKIDGSRWVYQGKHRKAYLEGMNCKGN